MRELHNYAGKCQVQGCNRNARLAVEREFLFPYALKTRVTLREVFVCANHSNGPVKGAG